jgi:hypothetical protein
MPAFRCGEEYTVVSRLPRRSWYATFERTSEAMQNSIARQL